MSNGILSNNIKTVIFHIATATITLFENFEILPGIYLTLPKSISLYLDMGNLNPSLFLGNVKQNKNTGYYVYSLKSTITVKLFEILQMLPGIFFSYKTKCFPSILIYQIPIQYHI